MSTPGLRHRRLTGARPGLRVGQGSRIHLDLRMSLPLNKA